MMKKNIFLVLFVALLVMGFVTPNAQAQVFVSDWIEIQPGINTTIPFKMDLSPLDVHIWTPVYYKANEVHPNADTWFQPIENLGCAQVVYVNASEIALRNGCQYRLWIKIYARAGDPAR